MELNHVRAGSGEPLLLIHGLGAAGLMWSPILDRLAAERDAIVIDMPGFGLSPELPAGVRATPANLGREIAEFARSLGVERPHVAGNSLGGWVALEMAKAGDAASVVAISPAGLTRRPFGQRPGTARRIGRALRPALGPAMRAAPVRRRLLSGSVARPENLTADEATKLIAGWLDSPGYAAANHEMRAAVFEHPELVGVPVTIARGDRDRLLGPPVRERMPPGTDYVELPGCGHTPTWDAPELVAELILRRSAPRGGPGRAETAAAPEST